jgi:hypothetical protein
LTKVRPAGYFRLARSSLLSGFRFLCKRTHGQTPFARLFAPIIFKNLRLVHQHFSCVRPSWALTYGGYVPYNTAQFEMKKCLEKFVVGEINEIRNNEEGNLKKRKDQEG